MSGGSSRTLPFSSEIDQSPGATPAAGSLADSKTLRHSVALSSARSSSASFTRPNLPASSAAIAPASLAMTPASCSVSRCFSATSSHVGIAHSRWCTRSGWRDFETRRGLKVTADPFQKTQSFFGPVGLPGNSASFVRVPCLSNTWVLDSV